MIALQSLKYFIWDYCLTKLFEGFQRNFATHSENLVIDGEDIRIGMRFTRITRVSKSTISPKSWHDCEILKIEKALPEERMFGDEYDETLITFSYGKIDCSNGDYELENLVRESIEGTNRNIRDILVTNYPDFPKFAFIK